MPRGQRQIPAAPFVAWLNDRAEQLLRNETLALKHGRHVGVIKTLAEKLGRSVRWIRNYLDGEDTNGEPTNLFERGRVEEMLHNADVGMWEVAEFARERYIPGWWAYADEEIALEPDAYCAKCREMVTPLEGRCLWCNSVLVREEAA